MDKETFIELVKNSIILQNLMDSGYSYITLEDKIICPFCEEEMIVEKNEDKWKMFCECDASKKYFDDINKDLSIIANAQKRINDTHKLILDYSLNYFKNDFKNKMFPKLQGELTEMRDMILNVDIKDFENGSR